MASKRTTNQFEQLRNRIGLVIAGIKSNNPNTFATIDHLIEPLAQLAAECGFRYAPVVRMVADVQSQTQTTTPATYRPARKGGTKHNDWPLHLDAANIARHRPHVARVVFLRFQHPENKELPVDVVGDVFVMHDGTAAADADMAWAIRLKATMRQRDEAIEMLGVWRASAIDRETDATPAKTIAIALAAERYQVRRDTLRRAVKRGTLPNLRGPDAKGNAAIITDENMIAARYPRRK